MTLSIIIPWFKKLALFKVAVRQNRLFLDRRVQVVIVMDDASEEKEAVEFIASVHHVNWKVVVNDKPHGWRPPCSAINVGIRQSTGDYIIVMSPETMLNLPTNEYLFRELRRLKTRRFYMTGQIHNIEFNQGEVESPCFGDVLEYRRAVLIEKPKDGFGFILVPRQTIEEIHCYDESRRKWGGDDDDIRLRLRRARCKYICDPQIRLVHMWHTDTDRKGSHERFGKIVKLTNQENWGMEFNRVAYETRNEPVENHLMKPFPPNMGETIRGVANETNSNAEVLEESPTIEGAENHTNPEAGSERNDAETVAGDAGQGLDETPEQWAKGWAEDLTKVIQQPEGEVI